MAGYLGSTPVPQATQHRESFTATAAQTTFATAGYTVGFVDVYLNGVHLTPADVTATNGSDVVLGACLVNDIVDVISHSAFELNAQTFTGDFTVDGTTLAVDSTNNRVGVGTTSPLMPLHISGTGDGGIQITKQGSVAARIKTVSGALVFGVDGSNGDTERMRIDATGAVTMPLQPAFEVKPASKQSNIAINSQLTIVFGTEVFDQNADFASNTFTAPVAGKYQFNFSLFLSDIDSAAAYYNVYITTTNENIEIIFDPDFGQDAAYWNITGSVLCELDASDTAFLRIQQSGGTSQTDIDVASRFSGYLVA